MKVSNQRKLLMLAMQPLKSEQQGFTLLETMVALLILLAALAGIVPLFITYKLGAINNQLETGGIAVSQGILDEIRQKKWQYLPTSNVASTVAGTASYMGKTYNYTTTYCPADAQPANICDDNTKFIRVKVSYNAREVFEAETIYTRFN
ncbi:MAG: prepilin-type N-terminal cleavage/methylation domain-containing protein [Thermosynechococcaceae cyanobacterium]